MSPRRRSALAGACLLAAAACGESPAPVAEVAALRAASCAALAAPARRAEVAAASNTAAAAAIIASAGGFRLPPDVAPLGGVVLSDSGIFVLDLALGHLTRVGVDGRVVARIGRSGRGPGEFDPPPGMVTAGPGDFLGASGDTLVAFDGRNVQWFTADGVVRRSVRVPDAARSMLESPRRMRVDAGIVYLESMTSLVREGGRLVALDARRFTVWRLDGDSVAPVLRLELPQLPRAGSGGFFGSPAEAAPQWDVREGCLAAMDGNAAQLILVDVATGAGDTLALPLPPRFADAERLNRELPGLGPDFVAPPPALLARVVGMALSADGTIWLRPVRGDSARPGAEELWRFDLPTRGFRVNTLAAFPRIFARNGTPIGYRADDEGSWHLVALSRKD